MAVLGNRDGRGTSGPISDSFSELPREQPLGVHPSCERSIKRKHSQIDVGLLTAPIPHLKKQATSGRVDSYCKMPSLTQTNVIPPVPLLLNNHTNQQPPLSHESSQSSASLFLAHSKHETKSPATFPNKLNNQLNSQLMVPEPIICIPSRSLGHRQNLKTITVYVDGSFVRHGLSCSSGSGIWFSQEDPHNTHIPVPDFRMFYQRLASSGMSVSTAHIGTQGIGDANPSEQSSISHPSFIKTASQTQGGLAPLSADRVTPSLRDEERAWSRPPLSQMTSSWPTKIGSNMRTQIDCYLPRTSAAESHSHQHEQHEANNKNNANNNNKDKILCDLFPRVSSVSPVRHSICQTCKDVKNIILSGTTIARMDLATNSSGVQNGDNGQADEVQLQSNKQNTFSSYSSLSNHIHDHDHVYNHDPRTATFRLLNSSVRAELYAVVVALYIIRYKKRVDCARHEILIKQDCQAAIQLLGFVQNLRLTPGRWIWEDPAAKNWVHPLSWNENLTFQTVVDYFDVLDEFWMLTRDMHVRFSWIPAHLDENGTRLKPKSNSYHNNHNNNHNNHNNHNNNYYIDSESVAHRIHPHDRVGNDWADIFAKSAKTQNARDPLVIQKFYGYPLYPTRLETELQTYIKQLMNETTNKSLSPERCFNCWNETEPSHYLPL